MNGLSQFLVKVEEALSRLLLISIVALVFMEVLLRWIGSPTTWSVAIAQLLFIWIIFLGANQALRKNGHIGIDILTRLLPVKLQYYIQLVMFILIAFFLAIIAFFGFKLTTENTSRLISGTAISYSYVTMAVPVGCLLMLVTVFQKILTLFTRKSDKHNGEPPHVSHTP